MHSAVIDMAKCYLKCMCFRCATGFFQGIKQWAFDKAAALLIKEIFQEKPSDTHGPTNVQNFSNCEIHNLTLNNGKV